MKDTDCKGDRVCEKGTCVSGSLAVANSSASASASALTQGSGPVPAPSATSCTTADWSPATLPPLLRVGFRPNPAYQDRIVGEGFNRDLYMLGSSCTDDPNWAAPGPALAQNVVAKDGASLRVLGVLPAGNSGRGLPGGQCSYGIELSPGVGKRIVLSAEVAPFNEIGHFVRAGNAGFVSLNFNGYAREAPKGGNYVVALDFCDGTVKWRSANQTSNGPLVLLGNYLITGYGFTNESRTLYVLNVHTGAIVQRLTIPGNPDAIELKGGLLLVETNHGGVTFELAGQ